MHNNIPGNPKHHGMMSLSVVVLLLWNRLLSTLQKIYTSIVQAGPEAINMPGALYFVKLLLLLVGATVEIYALRLF
jgi:hypothetical protein